MAWTPIPGVGAKIQGGQFGGFTFAFDTVKFSPKTKLTNITNATSIYEQYLAGSVGGKIQLSGPWDADNMGFFLVGATVQLSLIWSQTLVGMTTTCTAIIEDIDVELKVDDIARCSVTCQITGAFSAGLLTA